MNTQRAYGWTPVLLATMVMIGWTAAARADDAAYNVPKQVVVFADLNMDSLVGASALYHRIDSAAARVCGAPIDLRELAAAARFSACKEQAIERAVNAVNSAVLTSLHVAKTGRAERPITLAKVTQ
jgi:UrcA family protein